jgi:cytochrome c-type biogenesis protein CcmH
VPADRRTVTSRLVAVAMVALLAVTVAVLATSTGPRPDRAQQLAESLRCPVCQSVSIADSPSETAVAMRQAVADQIAAGRTDAEVLAYFRARYGDWVVLDPPVRGSTLALWVVPVAAAVLGGAAVLALVRRRDEEPAGELSADDRVRVDAAVDAARAAAADRDDADRDDAP